MLLRQMKLNSSKRGSLKPWILRAICFAGLSWAGMWVFEYQGTVAANVPIIRTADSVACSRDGSTIVTGGSEMVVKLWDARTRQLKRSLKGHQMQIQKVAISPDGTLVASASADWTVKVWDAETGQLKFSVLGHRNGSTSVAFSPDGKKLASCGWDGFFRLWDATSGQLLKEVEVPRRTPDSAKCLQSVVFSPDGTKVAVVNPWDAVRLLEVNSGRQLKQWSVLFNSLYWATFSPDGTTLASASDNGTVWQWDVNTGKQKSVTSGKGEWNCEMAYSPDGSVLAVNGSVCIEGQSYDAIRILDAQTGKQIRLIKDKYGCPSIAFATHGSEIVREQDGLRFLQVR